MSKQHEILAVEQSKKAAANKIREDAKKQFHSKADRYEGFSRTYQPIDDAGEVLPSENKYLGDEDRVPAKLDYVATVAAPFFDVVAQKEATNQVAKADIEIDGQVVLPNVPATTLLFLEKELKQHREILDAIPTLDPALSWKWNDSQKWWETEPVNNRRTVKEEVPLVLYEATKEHPAQVKTTSIEKLTGHWSIKRFSGTISVREKADLITRCDLLINAVIQARMRANEAEVIDQKIGKILFDYIHSPIAGKI